MFLVEWSEHKRAVHFTTMNRMIETNRQAMLSGSPADNSYCPVFVSSSEDEAREFANILEHRRDSDDALRDKRLQFLTCCNTDGSPTRVRQLLGTCDACNDVEIRKSGAITQEIDPAAAKTVNDG